MKQAIDDRVASSTTDDQKPPASSAGEGTGGVDAGVGVTDGTKSDDKQLPFHEHPRFKEITTQNRELKEVVVGLQDQINETTKRLEQAVKPKGSSRRDKMIARRIEQGWEEKDAAEDVDDILAATEEKVAPFRQDEEARKTQNKMVTAINSRIEKFKETLKEKGLDYDDEKMTAAFKNLSPQMQRAIAEDESLRSLEMLHDSVVKSDGNSSSSGEPASKTGKISGKPAKTNATSKWSKSKVEALSTEEYVEHQAEIDEAIRTGNYDRNS